MSDEKRKTKRGERAGIGDEGAKKNINKQTKTKALNSSPLPSLPPKSFHKPRKFNREKLAESVKESVASRTNDAVSSSEGTMFPTRESEPKEDVENA